MSDPKIADRQPKVLIVEPGTYWWCTCGRSADQPYRDGSHRGSDFQPLRVEIAQPGRVAFCLCKHTADQPFCDGTHSRLDE